ncbi:MAG: cysteine desulfurase [Bacteroidota bacterium]
MPFDPTTIKKQFPIFERFPDLVYLDNAATTQKPRSVIKAISDFYTYENANIHRGVYNLSAQVTQKYEAVRQQLSEFFEGDSPNCFSFCSGATEGINWVVKGYLENILQEGDNVVISAMEHHANLIPWQQLCIKNRAKLQVIPLNEKGEIDLQQFSTLLTQRTKIVALTHVSNTLGTINPIAEIVELAHQKAIPVLIDGAQSVGHFPINLYDLAIDFLVFSGHKIFGPTGIGVLYCKEKYHDQIKATKFGGGSIKEVSFNETSWKNYPHSMEAGTPHIAGVIGLGKALGFINEFDLTEAFSHEQKLAILLKENLKSIGGIELLGNPTHFSGIASFIVENIHPHDVASFLAEQEIAVRAGHHCTQPLLASMGVPATVRVSFSVYNIEEDVVKLVEVLKELKKFWL